MNRPQHPQTETRAPEEAAPIPSAVVELDRALSGLEGYVETLIDRLRPALTPEGSIATAADGLAKDRVRPSRSHLATELDELAGRVRRLSLEVVQLFARLEV